MSDKENSGFEENTDSKGGRQKQKIRIKYRQRVKIRRRPKGYKLKQFWKKRKSNLVAYVVLAILIGATAYMVVQVTKQQLEKNKHEKNQKLRLR